MILKLRELVFDSAEGVVTTSERGATFWGRLAARCVALKIYAARLGLDADAFSGHRLRSGFLTSRPRAELRCSR
jgi:hypothetical protein